jgi:toxin ParE1/3/4
MTKPLVITAQASTDLDDHFAYIAGKNLEAAMSFFDAARIAFAQIARTPGIGSICPLKNSSLEGLRK